MSSTTEHDEDTTTLLMVAAHVLPILAGWAIAKVPAVAQAALSVGVVVPASQAVWVLPVGGVGLDLARVAILAGVVVLLLTTAVLLTRRRLARRAAER